MTQTGGHLVTTHRQGRPPEPVSWWLGAEAEWPIWRIVTGDHGIGLREIDEHWSVDDVLDFMEIADVVADVGEWKRPEPTPTTVHVGTKPRG